MKDHDVDADHPSNDTAASTPTAAESKADTASSTAQSGAAQADSANMSGSVAATGSPVTGPPPPPPSATIHMRCLIVTQDASIIIGRAGKHVNEIREKSGARVVVSESIPGNPERILNVSGPLDAVSKVNVLHFIHAGIWYSLNI